MYSSTFRTEAAGSRRLVSLERSEQST